MKKIFIYSEDLSEPLDEGIKRAAFQIINALAAKAQILVAFDKGQSVANDFVRVHSNRLLLDRKLRRLIVQFSPDLILYIPRWCGTFAGFIRNRVLHGYDRKARSVMVILQPKRLSPLQKKIIRRIRPDIVYTPSPRVMALMEDCRIPVEFLPLSADLDKFKPVDSLDKKQSLRKKYGLPPDQFIILHVGHVNRGRNLEALLPLQSNASQVVIVSSSSTGEVSFKDAALKDSLVKKGIIVIDRYLENVEEVYQLADVYVFPVLSEGGCIGAPLSILEARACGLPVVSTNFGGLGRLFPFDEKGLIYTDPGGFLSAISAFKSAPRSESGDHERALKLEKWFQQTVSELADQAA